LYAETWLISLIYLFCALSILCAFSTFTNWYYFLWHTLESFQVIALVWIVVGICPIEGLLVKLAGFKVIHQAKRISLLGYLFYVCAFTDVVFVSDLLKEYSLAMLNELFVLYKLQKPEQQSISKKKSQQNQPYPVTKPI
jgi:hypothetical protein